MAIAKTIASKYDSGYTVHVDRVAGDDDVALRINTPVNRAGLTITATQAVQLAIAILKDIDPDMLVAPKFIDLPVGTFLRRYIDGKIVRITNAPEGDHRELEDDENWADFNYSDGAPRVVFQRPDEPSWAILEDDQVEIQTHWRFKP